MVSYGLREEDDSEYSLEQQTYQTQRQQQRPQYSSQQQGNRKRRYPIAFPEEQYPYSGEEDMMVHHEEGSGFGALSSVMDCFNLVFSWIGHVGGRIFTTGTSLYTRSK